MRVVVDFADKDFQSLSEPIGAAAMAELKRAKASRRQAAASRLQLAEADFNRYQAVCLEGGVSRRALES